MPSNGVRRLLLVAQPLVEERKAALPAIIEASRQLAERLDFAVLRVDYPGTGDSEGNFADFGPDDWSAALADAAAWLGEHFGSLPLICLGIRTGAALLLANAAGAFEQQLVLGSKFSVPGSGAASVPLPWVAMVLWDPVSGEEVVKQWLQRHMVNDMVAYGKARVSRSALEATLAGGGSADLDGFELTGAQYAGLSSLGLGNVSARTLAVVSGRPSPATAKWAEANAGTVELVQLRTPPYWNSVGYVDTADLRHATEAWLVGEGTGNREQGIGNGERGTGDPSTLQPFNSSTPHPTNRQTVKP
jgi:pimeloyl-ACP methyl ester carboxylesterase